MIDKKTKEKLSLKNFNDACEMMELLFIELMNNNISVEKADEARKILQTYVTLPTSNRVRKNTDKKQNN